LTFCTHLYLKEWTAPTKS